MERVKYNFNFDGRAISIKFEHLTKLLKHFDEEFYTYMLENQVGYTNGQWYLPKI